MKITAIASIVNSNMAIIGLRLLDIDTNKTMDVSISNIIDVLNSGKAEIENLKLIDSKLVGINFSLNNLPKLLNGALVTKSTITILGKMGETWYKITDYKGEVKTVSIDTAIRYAKKHGLSNGKIITKNGRERISDMTGEDDNFNKDDEAFQTKLAQVKKYKSENERIMDFDIQKTYRQIFISRVYDGFETVIVPDFVDGFKSAYESNKNSVPVIKGPFKGNRGNIKIIANSNIHGKLDAMFSHSIYDNINLDDFDTSNIKDMGQMFGHCITKVINIGGINSRFNTEKVIKMSSMFFDCKAEKIILGDNFNTANVLYMDCMFVRCSAKEIELGNNFDTSKVENMINMFSECGVKELKLGNKFNTANVLNMGGMFSYCQALKIDLGSNFDTSKVSSMRNMFMGSQVETIDLGNKFNMDNTEYADNMFKDCAAKQIIVGADVSAKTIDRLRRLTNIPVLQR